MPDCNCGSYGDATSECHCTPGQVQHYLCKISGSLLDRIGIQVEIPSVPPFFRTSQTACADSLLQRVRQPRMPTTMGRSKPAPSLCALARLMEMEWLGVPRDPVIANRGSGLVQFSAGRMERFHRSTSTWTSSSVNHRPPGSRRLHSGIFPAWAASRLDPD